MVMKQVRLVVFFVGLLAIVIASAYLLAAVSSAQTVTQNIRPDIARALNAKQGSAQKSRRNAYSPARSVAQRPLRQRDSLDKRTVRVSRDETLPTGGPIVSGTALSKVLHTSMLSMT